MMKFTLAQDRLPFNFFDEVGFSYQDVAIDSIKRKFTWLNKSECEGIFGKYEDDFTEILYELRDSNSLNDNWVGDDEVDEATGTWCYSDYEVVDIKRVRIELEKEVRGLMEEVLKEIDLKC